MEDLLHKRMIEGKEMKCHYNNRRTQKKFIGKWIHLEERYAFRPTIPRIEPLECCKDREGYGHGARKVSESIMRKENDCPERHRDCHSNHTEDH